MYGYLQIVWRLRAYCHSIHRVAVCTGVSFAPKGPSHVFLSDPRQTTVLVSTVANNSRF